MEHLEQETCVPVQQRLRALVETPGLGEEEGDRHDQNCGGCRVQALEERSPTRDELRLLEEPEQDEDDEKNKNLEQKQMRLLRGFSWGLPGFHDQTSCPALPSFHR